MQGRRRGGVGVGQPAPLGAVTIEGRRPLYLLSRSSDRREWPPFGPPGGGCSPARTCWVGALLGTSRAGKDGRPTRRQERFAGPEDLLWGPHLGARDPSAGASRLCQGLRLQVFVGVRALPSWQAPHKAGNGCL
jgi:hypothetical protein